MALFYFKINDPVTKFESTYRIHLIINLATMRKFFIVLPLVTYFILSTACSDKPQPVTAENGMVVSTSSYASKVGVEILKKGGNAIDAAVAVGFALAVTYPSAGNLGGGGFMVIHLADGKNIAIDYREKAPLSADRDMYLNEAGEFVPELSQFGTTSAGVPGSVAGLIYALEKYGTMSLAEVIQPAIDLAGNGWRLEKRDSIYFSNTIPLFSKYPSSMKIFTKEGVPYSTGELFIQSDLAWTLRTDKRKRQKRFLQR
ncbi:MAG: gamma-glutamyltransferase [Ignavibacteriaceae bacterium]|nr:gamma-glutamyltransferase [Ignavibacteriaceae bacterium]